MSWLYTAPQLERARLSGLPKTGRAIARRLPVGGESGRGRPVYRPEDMPFEARVDLAEIWEADRQTHLEDNLLSGRAPGLPPMADGAATARLKDWQRRVMAARAALVQEVLRLARRGAGLQAARAALVEMASAGALPPWLQALVAVANARAGDRRTLSVASLRRWHGLARGVGGDALAPLGGSRPASAPWFSDFLALYARPGKPSIAACRAEMARAGCRCLPSVRTMQRAVHRLGAVARQAGRMGPRELKTIRPYIVRDIAALEPADIYTADGHTADLEVASPETGRPFRPEIISVIDVRTRLCVGWSTGVAEGAWLVADALRMAAASGIPAIFYVDRGKGFINRHIGDEVVGVLGRLGTTLETALPYNSQARGVVERFHQSCWVRGARFLAGFVGAGMDREARQRVYQRTRRDIELTGRSDALISWPGFIAWCSEQVDAYNAAPHSALPEVRDPETGALRHLSPAEAWAGALEAGAELSVPHPAALEDLFRPYATRQVSRGMVSLFRGKYFAAELEQHHGQTVLVGYDIHDPGRVWVRDAEGRLLAVAELDANVRDYFPPSALERAREKRTAGQIARLEAKAERLAPPPAVIPHEQPDPDPEGLARWREQEIAAQEAARAPETREDRYCRWLGLDARVAAGAPLDQDEAAWWREYPTTPEHRTVRKLIEEYGEELILRPDPRVAPGGRLAQRA